LVQRYLEGKWILGARRRSLGKTLVDARVAAAGVRSKQDLWHLQLDRAGIAPGAMADRMSDYFDSLGIAPGDANARWLTFWESQ
jgi:hypothetical protein